MPLLLVLVFAGIEVTRYIIIIQKVEKAAYTITNLVATYSPATTTKASGEINEDKLRDILGTHGGGISTLDRLMSPYGGDVNKQAIIITSFVHRVASANSEAKNLIRLQVGIGSVEGGGLMAVTSEVNGAMQAAAFSSGALCTETKFTNAYVEKQMAEALDQENIIVGEVFFQYQPLLKSVFGIHMTGLNERTIARRFFMHPRNGDLIDLPPGIPAIDDPSKDVCP